MGLFCLACGVYSYRNVHKCNTPINSLIPLSKPCKPIAISMYALGIELLSAGCFTTPVPESLYDHHIIFNLELKHEIPPVFNLPANWYYYDEIVGTDIKISAIGYSETFAFLGTVTVQERCQQIVEQFSMYWSQFEKDSLTAVLRLYNTGDIYAE